MKTKLGHLQFNIAAANLGFYTNLLAYLGWETLYAGDDILGVGDGGATSLWFNAAAKDVANDHDGPGLNHIGFNTDTPADVDTAVAHLREQGIELLYGTPCRRPEYEGEGSIYYSAMFMTPDGIVVEVVYSGPAV